MSHHLTRLRSRVVACLSPFAKLEACESEASSDFHASRFRLRLAYLQKAFWPLHRSSADHTRCLGRPGNCGNYWSTLWHLVVGGSAFGIFDLCRGCGTRPSPNMPCLTRWESADICRHFCALVLGSKILGCPNTVSFSGRDWPAALGCSGGLRVCVATLLPWRVFGDFHDPFAFQ